MLAANFQPRLVRVHPEPDVVELLQSGEDALDELVHPFGTGHGLVVLFGEQHELEAARVVRQGDGDVGAPGVGVDVRVGGAERVVAYVDHQPTGRARLAVPRDAHLLADGAPTAIAPHQVPGPQSARCARSFGTEGHLHAFVVLAEPRDGAAPEDLAPVEAVQPAEKHLVHQRLDERTPPGPAELHGLRLY
jgi:hypothetical protein